jgi:hypothetical protein
MNRREYIELIRQAEFEYRKKLEAIETVWRMTNGEPPPYTEAEQPALAYGGEPISLVDAVRQLTYDIEGPFTPGMIGQGLEERFPYLESHHPASISNVLRRMADAGELALMQPGSGSQPNVYMKPP